MESASKDPRGKRVAGPAERLGPFLLAGLTAVLAGACGRQAVVQSGPGDAAQTVDVRLSEYQIDMPMAITAGEVTFRIRNDGNQVHSFEIEGNGVERPLGAELAPGETATLRVQLGSGSYDIFCPVGDHERRGMFRRLTTTRG